MDEGTPLAHYRGLDRYVPKFGDFVVWSGWFSQWHGVVNGFNLDLQEVDIIFSVTPFVLLTLDPEEIKRETHKVKISKIRSASKGSWAIMQHDTDQNTNIWYV
jgi:hypothetical protein